MECREQWMTKNSFSRQEELIFKNCDRNRRARMSTLLSLCASVAGNDYDARGLPYETLLKDYHQVVLLSRITLKIHRQPQTRDILTITTWENGSKGAHMRRVYEMTDQTGELCVSGRSDWILVDPDSRSILRPSAFTVKEFGVCPKDIDCPECRKITLPKEGIRELGVRKITWSDLDGNGHVYSGNYGDIIWDALPPELQDARPREFSLNYSREATLGEELRLMGIRRGATFQMEAVSSAGICFTCECLFDL